MSENTKTPNFQSNSSRNSIAQTSTETQESAQATQFSQNRKNEKNEIEEIEKIKKFAEAFVNNVRAFLNEQASKIFANSFHLAQGRKDAQLGIDLRSPNGYYADTIERLVKCYRVNEMLRLKKEISEHYNQYKNFKKRLEQKNEMKKKLETHPECETSYPLAFLYVIGGILLMLCEIPFLFYALDQALGMHTSAAFIQKLKSVIPILMVFAMFFSTFYFKIFIDEIVFSNNMPNKNESPLGKRFILSLTNLNKSKVWYWLLFIANLTIFFWLGLIRASSVSSIRTTESPFMFILITLTFPLIGSTCLRFGAHPLHMAILKNEIQRIEKDLFDCKLRIRKVAIEMAIRKNAYSNIIESIKNAYLRGIEEGRLTPEDLPDSGKRNGLYTLSKRSLVHDIAELLRQRAIDRTEQGNDRKA